MIKLTVLHYELKTSSLKFLHNVSQFQESAIFKWEQEVENAKLYNGDLPDKPFLEPFEFKQDDYTITEKPFRIRLEDIYSYQENNDNITEITVGGDVTYTIKESVEEIDRLFTLPQCKCK
jgi:hypothetical protein